MSGHLHMAFNGYLTDCPGCSNDYIAATANEANDADRLCPQCFDSWAGMTLEELLSGL
jgi:hypothetical protein